MPGSGDLTNKKGQRVSRVVYMISFILLVRFNLCSFPSYFPVTGGASTVDVDSMLRRMRNRVSKLQQASQSEPDLAARDSSQEEPAKIGSKRKAGGRQASPSDRPSKVSPGAAEGVLPASEAYGGVPASNPRSDQVEHPELVSRGPPLTEAPAT